MENGFENVSLVKHCQIGDFSTSLYADEENGRYICVDSLESANDIEGYLKSLNNDDSEYTVRENFITDDYDDALLEMQMRIVDNLNSYFADDDETVLS